MKADVYDLGRGIGVAELEAADGTLYVAEVNLETMRVLPQSVRRVQNFVHTELPVDDDPTDQDHVDRMALAIARLRGRLAEFDDTTMARANPTELQAQARELRLEVSRLTGGA